MFYFLVNDCSDKTCQWPLPALSTDNVFGGGR